MRPFPCQDAFLFVLTFPGTFQAGRKKPHRCSPVRQVTIVNYLFFSKRFGVVRLPSKPDFGMGFAVCSNLGAL